MEKNLRLCDKNVLTYHKNFLFFFFVGEWEKMGNVGEYFDVCFHLCVCFFLEWAVEEITKRKGSDIFWRTMESKENGKPFRIHPSETFCTFSKIICVFLGNVFVTLFFKKDVAIFTLHLNLGGILWLVSGKKLFFESPAEVSCKKKSISKNSLPIFISLKFGV